MNLLQSRENREYCEFRHIGKKVSTDDYNYWEETSISLRLETLSNGEVCERVTGSLEQFLNCWHFGDG